MITPIIMAGGAGTRLRSASRESMPKQFIPLFGEHSTFQETLARVADANQFASPIVITSSDFRFLVAEQAGAVGVKPDIVLEPIRLDSGLAVAVAAILAVNRSPDAVVLVLAADHSMSDLDAFSKACHDAVAAATVGHIVTFGVKPTGPATSYGYLKPGKHLDLSGVHKLASFVEKPDAETAKRFCSKGYLWNSGNLMFRADVMRSEIERLQPAIAKAAAESVAKATRDLDFLRLAEEPFAQAPKISIDDAVMEKTDKAAVLPVSVPWSDIGSWDAVWRLSPKDEHGNATSGPVYVADAENVLVRGEPSIMTAVVGIDGIVVVATTDAVLVASREKAEHVKAVVDPLKAKGVREAIEHRRIYRPWGYYQGIDHGGRYQASS
jgi:mannose-1-phosphate guanylyltransferase/mannose-6-phosphate isomerase